MGRFKDALLLLSLLVVSEAMPHGQSGEETTTGSHESGTQSESSSKSSSKSNSGSGSHDYGYVTGLPLNIDQTVVHFEGGPCDFSAASRAVAHPLFCDRFLTCQPGIDDEGQIFNFYVSQLCAPGTVWNDDRRLCTFGTCTNRGGSQARRAVCTASGDPHFRQFDPNCWLHFQGLCTYIMARVNTTKCSGNLTADQQDFEVQAEHTSLGGNLRFGYIKYLHVTYKTKTYRLDPANSGTVTYNGVGYYYTNLALANDNVYFRKRNGELTMFLPNGVSVSVRRSYQGKVRVPPVLQGCMEGFCGNYDGHCGNDFITKAGVQLPYVRSFSNQVGNSWKTDPSCADTTNPHLPECVEALPVYRTTCRTALTRSSTSVFDKCDVDPINIDSCQADICPHVNNETAVQEVICDTIRRAMKVECDAMDLKPDNLPEYCKHCRSNPCKNQATCLEGVDTFTCVCAPGYQGKTCDEDIDDCRPNRCMNRATCVDGVNSYTCTCLPGFTGTNCETNIDDCRPNRCMNRATCVDGVNSYTCTCLPGFTGTNCETNIDDCRPNRCMNRATCVDGVNSYTCTCLPGFTGTNCETNIDDCRPNRCMNRATCVDGVNSYTCTCLPGFRGTNCETNIDDCRPNRCMNRATCVDGVNSYTCTCLPGFTGTNCETNIDDCRPNRCMNRATCVDGVNSYTCTCLPGFTGTNCETNIDDCRPNRCMNRATCVDGVNSYTCTCLPGFRGTNCETNIDDCRPNRCMNRATCVDGVNSYTCTCLPGFTGTNCETNIDDCRPNRCMNRATCVDGVNSYTCTCLPGFTGTNCETNIDDCRPNRCMNRATCVDGVNSYTCTCLPGFTGTNCETNIDDCRPNRCMNRATCIDGVNSYTCTCLPGFRGTNCETNTEDCTPDPCRNGATCVDGVNSYTCTCLPGFTGTNCETNIDDCSPNPCNLGRCSDGVNRYWCECPAGYTGRNCEIAIDNCLPNPCQRNAPCTSYIGGWTCDCPLGYTGKYCETDIIDCYPDRCQNGGTCNDLVNDYTCNCPPGYTGDNCETDIIDCYPDRCQNGGTCNDLVNDYTCNCPPGYTGDNCETDIPYCLPNMCLNGATCIDVVDGYACQCAPGYTGLNCGTDINECQPDRCQNGGTCNDLVNRYTCNCPPGYTGYNCETEVTTCNLDCENGGECGLIGGQTACICIDSFIGNLCQYDCSGSHSGPEFDACPCLGCDYGEGASLNAIGYVADPDNCAAFYQCHRSGANEITATWRICARPLVWSQNLLACAWLWQSADPTCEAFYPTEVSSTTTTTEITPTGKPTNCLGGDAVIYQIHPFLCSKYQLIICTSGTFVDLSCPNGLVFDGTKWVCDWPANVVNQPKQCVDVNCGHPCLEDGVMTCHRYPDTQQANCPFSFYADTKDILETSLGAVCNGISSYIKVDNMVNREVGNELRLEANFTCEGTNPIQPLVVNSDCQHDATFYVLLRATTGGYLVEMHVVGIKGEATHNSTTVLTVETRYSIVFSYDSVYKTMTLQVNGIITDEIPNIDLGVVMTGRAPLFICYFDRDCDNGRKQDYFKGKIHAVRVFNKIV